MNGVAHMRNIFLAWQFWALLSGAFGALTGIFVNNCIENVKYDVATFIRTIVIHSAACLLVSITGK